VTDMYEALEVCLKEIEDGAEIETVLLRFPEFAEELHPILDASMNARALSAPGPSAEIVKRNRAKVLQRASELREADARPRLRIPWFAPVRRLASTLAIVILVFISGTSLVGAASTSLPGDNLYPVKLSWERLQLFFLFDEAARDNLEVEYENERVEELQELFADKRSAEVSFNGLLTRQNGNEWLVAGIRVVIEPQADLPAEPVPLNSAVRVYGSTQIDGSVLATRVELLPPGAKLPDVDDEEREDGSVPGSVTEVPDVTVSQTPESEIKFDGSLNVLNGDFWTINGVPADVRTAEIIGTPAVNTPVKVEGYFNSDGLFIVTKIEFLDNASNDNSGSNSNDGGSDNSNDNDNGNDTGNKNDNDNSNGGDD